MSEHNLFYYPYASFTNVQLPLLKLAAVYFDKLVTLDPVGASWASIDADYPARQAVKQLQDVGILHPVAPADVLANYAGTDHRCDPPRYARPGILGSVRDAQRAVAGPYRWQRRRKTCRPTRSKSCSGKY
jgi:hypothetical protein